MLVLVWCGSAWATPSEAAGLGGLDLHYPDGLDTFPFFHTDLDVYTNPARAFTYRDQVQIDLGFAGGGAFDGVGLNPRGHLLVGLGETLALGIALNRSAGELYENAALGDTLDLLMLGSSTPGELGGGAFIDPVSGAGLGTPRAAVPLAAPIDLVGALDAGSLTFGLGLYAAFGQARSDSEQAVADPDDEWTRARTLSRSSWVTARGGVIVGEDGEGPVIEGWLRYTGVSAWSDAQAWGPEERGEWDDQDLVQDETVGLKGTRRVGGGARLTIPVTDTIELVPALLVDQAQGRTFADYRLQNDAEDPLETAVAQAEDDLLWATSAALQAGTGVVFRPQEALKVVGTVSGALTTTRFVYDDNAQRLEVPGTSRTRAEVNGSTVALPLVSIGAEYLVSPTFGVRGAIRSTTWLHRTRGGATGFLGLESDGFTLDEVSASSSAAEAGDLPPLTAAVGPTIRLGDLVLDGVIGGAFLGAGADLFSRVDAVFHW